MGGSGLERLQSVPNQMKKFRIVLPHVRPQKHIELRTNTKLLLSNRVDEPIKVQAS